MLFICLKELKYCRSTSRPNEKTCKDENSLKGDWFGGKWMPFGALYNFN